MKATVKLFAILREKAGRSEVALDLPSGATVADALAALKRRLPGLLDGAPAIMVAVNAEYVTDSHVLKEGDELALIPPVSGGAELSSQSIRSSRPLILSLSKDMSGQTPQERTP